MCKFGDIYFAELPILPGSQVQQGVRPVLIVSNDLNNYQSSVVSVVPLTASRTKHKLPTHVSIEGCGLSRPSTVLAEQILTLDQCRLLGRIGSVYDRQTKAAIQKALMIQLNMVA